MQKVIMSAIFLSSWLILGVRPSAAQTTAPSTYNAYTGTDVKAVPLAPALGSANSVVVDPTFGSRILRVTDANTNGGESFISTDSGFSRTWNANSTAIKLTGPFGDGHWLEFNPGTFQVGTGSGEPVLHPLSFGATWEWSAVQPDTIYYLSGSTIETYNTTSGASTPIASTPTGDPVTYMAAVIGLDNWVCAAAGAGSQNTYTKIFCVSPSHPLTWKFIDVVNATINGAAQSSPNWPTSAAGETIGIHDISGGTGPNWLEVTFHQQSWGANGGAVLDLSANTWSLLTNADIYWSGHVSMGNGRYENAAGSINGEDSRGAVLRDPDNLMNSPEYVFVMQPFAPWNNWCDIDHSSWLNSVTNSNAPILDSRYSVITPCQFAWSDEIIAAAVDGSNTVWRFAHNFNGGSLCYYAEAFAQISNDGNWALFSSYWGGALGPDTSFGCTTRIDTFIVDLKDATGPAAAPVSQSISFAPLSNVTVGAAPVPIVATASSGLPVSLSSTTAAVCSISGTSAAIVGAGTCSITASQLGNSAYVAATPVTRTFLVSPGPPTVVSLSPNAGAGASVTFGAVYSDPNGAGDLSELLLQVNTSQSSARACYVYYQPKGDHLYLANNAGTVWMTPALTTGVAGTASNSQCTLNAGSSSVTMSGNSLSLTVSLSFNSSFTISRNVYLYAAGASGQNSGWVQAGTWTPNPIAAPPTIVGFAPSAGAGASVTYTAVYSDPNGAGDLNTVLLQMNTIQSETNACYVYYQPQANHLYLSTNAGTVWMTPALTPGVAGTVSNSQCTLNAGSSKVTMTGNNLTLTVALSFNSAFVGFRSMYLYVAGFSGLNSGWVKDGTWTPNPVAEPPAIVSLSPNSGAGSSVTLRAVYADPNGAGDLNTLLLEINSSQSSANACYVYYQPQANLLYLANDAGAWITPGLTPGVAGTESNSQCTLNAGSSKAMTSGNNMTLSLALGFNSGFVTSRNVYLFAAGFSGLNSEWVQGGRWTPNPIAAPPGIVSLSPNSGSGDSVTLQAVYADPNGAGDLNTLLLQVNTIQSSANACYVYYQPQGNHLYLANNASVWIIPALTPGVAGMASNSQCTLNAGSSKVTMVGNNLTLSAALTFNGTVAGLQSVYLYATGNSGLSSGWVKEGAWTPNPIAGPLAIVIARNRSACIAHLAPYIRRESVPTTGGGLPQLLELLRGSGVFLPVVAPAQLGPGQLQEFDLYLDRVRDASLTATARCFPLPPHCCPEPHPNTAG